MYLSVRELLETSSLARAELIAGEKGLDNKFYIITPLDTPDIVEWLEGYELLVTQGYAIKEESPQRRNLIRDLHAKKVAALAIKKGRFLDPIPQYMIDDANELGLPLISLPPEMNWDAIMGPAGYSSAHFYTELIDLTMSGASLSDICNRLHELTQLHVAVLDANLDPLAISDGVPPDLLNGGRHLSEVTMKPRNISSVCTRYYCTPRHFKKYGVRGELFSLDYKGDRYGYIMAIADYQYPELSDYDVMTIQVASLSVVIEMLRQQNTLSHRYPLWNDYLLNLLDEQTFSFGELHERAAQLGFKLKEKYMIVIATAPLYENGEVYNRENSLLSFLYEHFAGKSFRTRFFDYAASVFCCIYADNLIFAVPEVLNNENIAELLLELRRWVAEYCDTENVKLSLGRVYPLTEIYKSHREAQKTARLSPWLRGDTLYFDELGFIKLFLGADPEKDLSEAIQIYEETIHPLILYDKENENLLLPTLEQYFANDLAIAKTADDLFLHRNTLRYRLSKIEKLTGLSLTAVEDIVKLSLGLQIYHALDFDNE